MTELFEELPTYLPKYLSTDAQEDLFRELRQFPDNIDIRLYTNRLANDRTVYQGDGLASVWVTNLPEPQITQARVMVLSNTCDVALENKRLLGPRLIYCPIISVPKYEELLRENAILFGEGLAQHIKEVRRQRVTSMFYLPDNGALQGDGIALLDRANNCDLQALDIEALVSQRLFTLSDYGFYMFLFKLSIHFTRIREGVKRS